MQGPRPPRTEEWTRVIDFLNSNLRPQASWSIANEYPTALVSANLNNVRIIMDNERIVSHAVLRPFILKTPLMVLKIGAVGSVVTDAHYRQQGLGSQLILDCLAEARRQDCDLAVLWTDLHDYYRKLNFELAGFEESFFIDKELPVDRSGLKFLKTTGVSPEAVLRLYNQHTVNSFRTAEDIRKFLQIPNTTFYTAWDLQGQLVAYAAEGKGADLTGYIHEWGGSVSRLMALFSWIFQERARPFTVIVPHHSINLKSAFEKHGVHPKIGYLGMFKIMNPEQFLTKLNKAIRLLGVADMLFTRRGETYQLNLKTKQVLFETERDFVHFIFGPNSEIPNLSPAENQTLNRVVPLPIWVWGWDSV